jgi:ABC-2 type transport system permease protein
MTRLLRAAWVIARRDYVATVWSKTFILFLLGPVLPIVLVLITTAVAGGSDEEPRGRPVVQVVMAAEDASALGTARAHLAPRLPRRIFPELRTVTHPDRDRPALTGSLERPRLAGPAEEVRDLGGPVALLIDQVRMERALDRPLPAPVNLQTEVYAPPETMRDRGVVAQGGQFVLFFLTILLAGMMITNMAEEKSNKIIELLAAAIPVDAIFFGKLLAILGASLTGIAAWATAGFVGVALFVPAGLPTPAVGWPLFLLLALGYFMTVFLLWAALYLAIGAQAGSAREAQTLSMPMSLGQAFLYAIASAQAPHPDKPIAIVAAIIPWSSSYAMIGRAAVSQIIWPHLLALAWQFVAIIVTIRVGARLFRTNILKSGRSPSSRRPLWRLGRAGES